VTLSTRLIVLFMAIVLCGAAGGQQDQHPERPRGPYCVTVPIEKMAEAEALIQGAKVDVGWRDERHLNRAFERLEQAENWFKSFSNAHVCPAGSPAPK
jgi:hypothetical protein